MPTLYAPEIDLACWCPPQVFVSGGSQTFSNLRKGQKARRFSPEANAEKRRKTPESAGKRRNAPENAGKQKEQAEKGAPILADSHVQVCPDFAVGLWQMDWFKTSSGSHSTCCQAWWGVKLLEPYKIAYHGDA